MRFSKKAIIITGIVLIMVGGLTWLLYPRKKVPQYDTVRVERRTVLRELQVAGTVEPSRAVDLAFAMSGRIAHLPGSLVVGSRVRTGEVLTALESADLHAAQLQALATLQQERAVLADLRAGTRAEEIAIAVVDVDAARRAHVDAQQHLANIRAQALIDLTTKYGDVANTVRAAFTDADDAVRKRLDELFANDATSPQLTFPTSDFQAEIDAERLRLQAETALQDWARELVVVTAEPSEESVVLRSALDRAAVHLTVIRDLLDRTFAATLASQNIAPATLNTYTTNIGTARTNANAARTSVDNLAQSIDVQRVTNQQAIDAAAADVNAQHSALTTAEATLRLRRAGSTPETIASQEARVAHAHAAVAEMDARIVTTAIRAPFDGIITVNDAKPGATATVGATLVRLIADDQLEIESDVPEVDLAGLTVGKQGFATFDAYGADLRLPVRVIAVDPAATVVEGVPTYRTRFVIDVRDERVRVGMTADVTVRLEERAGVLALPQRAIIRQNDEQVVRVVPGTNTSGGFDLEERHVTTGLRGSDGYVEVRSGVVEGDTAVRSVIEE